MIVARLYGGLGNQLFQYAAARTLADARQTELVIDTHWFEHIPRSATPRVYELDKYPVRARHLQGKEVLWAKMHQGRIVRRLPWLPRRWRHCLEKQFQWDPAFADLPDNCYLDGYWQAPRYFAANAAAIGQDLVPLLPLAERDQEIAARISQGNAVSVHVRRGDFVNPPNVSGKHAACSLDYYREALQIVCEKVPDPCFFVFSDDPQWTRNNLKLPGEAVYVEHNAAATAFQDLRLMSMCQHQIIANSSFSWWGAWLNSHPDKTVVAPRIWFNDQTDTRDLMPADWIRL